MEIRAYVESDQEAVVALWREAFTYAAPHDDLAVIIHRKLAIQRDLFLVATVEGEVVGTVIGGYDGHQGWIYSLAVIPRSQRQGIGTALVGRVEKALADRGCPKIRLQVLPDSQTLIDFYRRLGYGVEQRITMGKTM